MLLKFGLAALLPTAFAQGVGNGISKDTRACSEGVIDSTYSFMMKYFPVNEADDDCPNRECSCGKQARVSLKTSSDLSQHDDPHSNIARRLDNVGVSPGFGVHCVYAAGTDGARAKMSGSKTQEQIEAIFSGKFGDMSKYDPFMEYNTGFMTADISAFATPLKDDNIDFLSLSWADGSKNYVSVLVHPPNTQIIHEVVGESSSAPDWLLAAAHPHEGKRFHFGEQGPPKVASGTFTALWISRASTDISRDKTFLEDVFSLRDSAFKTSSGTDHNGNSYKMMTAQLSTSATTLIRLVQPDSATSGTYSVDWWEKYNVDVNAKYMKSDHCGWSLLGDSHCAYDWQRGLDQGTVTAALKSKGYPYFCKNVGGPHGTDEFPPPGGKRIHCYMTTPFAYQIQLDGPYNDPPSDLYSGSYPGELCATYYEDSTCGPIPTFME